MTTKPMSMKWRLCLGVVAAFALIAVVAAAVLAWNALVDSATGSSASGKIAFPVRGSHERAFSDLYVADADGSNGRVLSRCQVGSGDAKWLNFPFGCVVRSFAWSPNGRRVALIRGRQGGARIPTDLSLYVVDIRGERERRLPGCGGPKWLSCGDFFGSEPTWSPDSSRLVVTRRGRLVVFDVDRGTYRRLTHGCRPRVCFDMHPAWSPDGSTIAFARTEGPLSRSIYSVKPDGSGLKRLTNRPGWAIEPAWSHDGRRIAFDHWDEMHRGIYMMAADGSDEKPLAKGHRLGGPHSPSWSPDGTQIVYLSTVSSGRGPQDPVALPPLAAEVRVTKVHGSGGKTLYRSPFGFGHYVRPSWSPDGRHIAFGVWVFDDEDADRDRSGIFLMNADGTERRKFTATEFPVEIAWQPRP